MATVATVVKPQGVSSVTVGSVLKQAREAAGLTRVQLGQNTGISPRTIEKFEYDTADPSIGSLKKLCDALNLDYGDVMAEVGEALPGKSPPPSKPPQAVTLPSAMRATGPSPQKQPPAPVQLRPGSACAQALAKLQQVASAPNGMNTLALASATEDAKGQLSKLSYSDLLKVAVEVQFEAPDVPSPADVAKFSSDDRTDAIEALSCRLLVAAIYPDFEKLSVAGMQNLAADANSKLPLFDQNFLPDAPWQYSSTDAYLADKRKTLPPELLDLVERRQGIDLSNVKRYPRQSAAPSATPPTKTGGASTNQ